MNLQDHYESYKTSLHRDSLDGFTEYTAKTPTKNPARWHTIHQYVTEQLGRIQQAVAQQDEDLYRQSILAHQEAVILTFERMAKEYADTQENSVLRLLDRGWNWYKFSRGIIHFDNHVWIPRYCDHFAKELKSGKPVFCADEMKLVLSIKPRRAKLDVLLDTKSKRHVRVTGYDKFGGLDCCPVEQVNNGIVNDWSMRLFA